MKQERSEREVGHQSVSTSRHLSGGWGRAKTWESLAYTARVFEMLSELQLILYESVACNVTPKVTMEVLTLYGPIISHDISAHTLRVKTARRPP